MMLTQSNRFIAPHLLKVPEERLLALGTLVALLPYWSLQVQIISCYYFVILQMLFLVSVELDFFTLINNLENHF